MEELITVIIPLYNAEKTIEKCLKSVLVQTYNNLEILIINDGSSDNSIKKCENLCNLDNRIRIVSIQNHGVSYARNLGIKISRGKYISFVDADDTIEKDMIATLYKNLIKYKAELSICGYNKIFNNTLSTKIEKKRKRVILDRVTTMREFVLDQKFGGSVWNKLFIKEICKNISFDENIAYNEDRLYLYKYINIINKTVYDEDKLYNYFINSYSVTNNINNINRMFQMLEVNKEINRKIYEYYNMFEKEIVYNELKLNVNFYRFLTFSSNYYEYKKEKEAIREEIINLSNKKINISFPKIMMLEIKVLRISKVIYFIIIKISNNILIKKIRRKLLEK